MIHPIEQISVIKQQIRDWELSMYSTELQIKTHTRLVELGVGSEATLVGLKQNLAMAIAALEFLQGQLLEVAKSAPSDNGAVVEAM